MAGRLIAFMLLCTAVAVQTPARAALYEFTLEGVLIRADYPNTSLGEPLTLRYIVDDSHDADPDPNAAIYAARDTRITLPLLAFASDPGAAQPFYVNLHLTGEGLGYDDLVRGPGGDPFISRLNLLFPRGILGTDALPLTVPLQQANLATLEIGFGIDPRITAQITSYLSTPIPEPTICVGLLIALAYLIRRRTG